MEEVDNMNLTNEMIEQRMQQHREWQEEEAARLVRECFNEVVDALPDPPQRIYPRKRASCRG